jgi:cold shock CspA family protein
MDSSFSYFSHSFMDDLLASSQQQQQQQTYIGVVSSKQKTFGFLRSPDWPTDTFFHQSACADGLFEILKPGDAVSFQLDTANSKPGKRVPASVTRSTWQPKLEVLDPTPRYGLVMKPAAASQPHPQPGVLRYAPLPGKVQHLTFRHTDVTGGEVSAAAAAAAATAAELAVGQAVCFRVLTDKRAQQVAEASPMAGSARAVLAYQRATQVTPIPPQEKVRHGSYMAGPSQILPLPCASLSTVSSAAATHVLPAVHHMQAALPLEVRQQLVLLETVAAMFDA